MALTNKDAAIILAMVKRGDKKHDIAAWFGENQARVKEVENGEYGVLPIANSEDLPPRGAPGPKGRVLRGKVGKAVEMLEGGDAGAALRLLREGLARFDAHQS